MSENEKKILEMLANEKISVDEAYQLLSALKANKGAPESTAQGGTTGKPRPKYLRVTVQPGCGHEYDSDVDRVNVRVPMSLVRSGIKFTSLLPPEARDKVTGALHEKGIDFDVRNLKPEDMDEFMEALSELEVDAVNSDGDTIKVYVE